MLATYKTSKMMAQLLFESVCNCLGTPGHPGKPGSRTWPEGTSDSSQEDEMDVASSERNKRSARLELRHDVWNGVFSQPRKASSRRVPPPEKSASQRTSRKSSSKSPPQRNTSNDSEQKPHIKVGPDGRLLTDSKERGTTSRRRRSKSRGKSPDTIFRKRTSAEQAKKQSSAPPSTFSQLLSNHQVANALCFATPVRDDDEEDVNSVVTAASDDCSSAANTLNTAGEDDTIMFEVKYGSRNKLKRREPMMLYPQYKVVDEKDELRRIVANDSHKSLSKE